MELNSKNLQMNFGDACTFSFYEFEISSLIIFVIKCCYYFIGDHELKFVYFSKFCAKLVLSFYIGSNVLFVKAG